MMPPPPIASTSFTPSSLEVLYRWPTPSATPNASCASRSRPRTPTSGLPSTCSAHTRRGDRMRYASTSTLPEPVVEYGRFTISEATRSRGSVNGEPLDIDRELRGGIRQPHLVAEGDGVLL